MRLPPNGRGGAAVGGRGCGGFTAAAGRGAALRRGAVVDGGGVASGVAALGCGTVVSCGARGVASGSAAEASSVLDSGTTEAGVATPLLRSGDTASSKCCSSAILATGESAGSRSEDLISTSTGILHVGLRAGRDASGGVASVATRAAAARLRWAAKADVCPADERPWLRTNGAGMEDLILQEPTFHSAGGAMRADSPVRLPPCHPRGVWNRLPDSSKPSTSCQKTSQVFRA